MSKRDKRNQVELTCDCGATHTIHFDAPVRLARIEGYVEGASLESDNEGAGTNSRLEEPTATRPSGPSSPIDAIRDELLEVGFWDTRSEIEKAHLEQTLARISAIVVESLPKEWDECDGWDVHFSAERKCCPGDDIAYAHNKAIEAMRQQWSNSQETK